MQSKKDLIIKNRYKIVGIIIIIFIYFLYTSQNESNNNSPQLTSISESHIQKKGETSYFLSLKPDNLANLRVELDVIDYNQNYSEIFSIVQKDPKFELNENNKIYQGFYPNLTYLYYSDKIYSMSSNTDVSYRQSEVANFTVDLDNNFEISNQKIDLRKITLRLPENIKKTNISNFKLLMYLQDSDSESNLKFYPFDSINTYIRFEFPNNSNVNIIVEIPYELKSYKVKPSVFDENKNPRVKDSNSKEFPKIYDGVYEISSTNNVNHEKYYTRIELKMNRAWYSSESLSFFIIIVITLWIYFYIVFYEKIKMNPTEILSLYLALIAIPMSVYLNNRPPSLTGKLTIYEFGLLECILLLLLLKLWKNPRLIAERKPPMNEG